MWRRGWMAWSAWSWRGRGGGSPRPCSGGADMRKPYIPLAAGLPALLGLIPLFAAAGLFVGGRPGRAGVALLTLLTYSAVSLSFLGGARWGYEAANERPRLSIMA